ncbi:MAG: hypothetical protein KA498_02410, partial [Neisseriaceae bacterium]|nr:hypothetical protein [Neisseriaceae bacterium]
DEGVLQAQVRSALLQPPQGLSLMARQVQADALALSEALITLAARLKVAVPTLYGLLRLVRAQQHKLGGQHASI